MPSFPTSVKSFVSRSAGDVIQPAHVNDVQDEIAAVEDGYLNGTARLNSSNSTVVHLSATAGMNVVGNSTLGSTITLGTVPYLFPSTAPSSGQIMVCASTGTPNVLSWRSVTLSAMSLVTTSDAESTTTSSVMATMKDITGLSIPATSGVKLMWSFRKSSGAADQMLIQVSINGQVHASTTAITQSSTAAGNGFGSIEIGPRDANNPARLYGHTACVEVTPAVVNIELPTTVPAAASTVTGTITALSLQGRNANGVQECRIGNVKVYEISGA